METVDCFTESDRYIDRFQCNNHCVPISPSSIKRFVTLIAAPYKNDRRIKNNFLVECKFPRILFDRCKLYIKVEIKMNIVKFYCNFTATKVKISFLYSPHGSSLHHPYINISTKTNFKINKHLSTDISYKQQCPHYKIQK